MLPAASASLALPQPRAGSGRPASRRRAALGAALLVLVTAAALLATGTSHPGAEASANTPRRPAAPRVATAGPGGRRGEERGHRGGRAGEPRPAEERVVAPAYAAALFAEHSWYVPPPPPPPPPPAPAAPPPEPTAPPLPFTFLGSFAPGGDAPVYFLARGDRVIDARVGDKLDGVYRFEDAVAGQLVFVYLPLNIRQNLTTSVPR
jgi:hypothetical protein